MSEPFLGEIRLFANNYAPRNWAFCEGQILSINSNPALFSLLGTVYGGNGVSTFALPDYRGRVPIHVSQTIPLGSAQGEASHTLTSNEMPIHTHQAVASQTNPTMASPLNNVWAAVPNSFGSSVGQNPMNSGSLSTAGGSQAHNNMQPYTVLNYAIAIEGIFPSRN
ncbi:phage tail collar [Paenibacillus vortex V453]|uniref:Phage tail protein n=2 Tax=Paenibacillus TaxID=44249 RepID=A0A163LS67_9BACL|nr:MULTISPECIES: tail fiber protein [Paenibacillus]AWP28116.1 phage tail protein [Paenibacillus sp. Cedars]EFU41260.1 phage tail collar [Paenibacillus vortex V453]KZS48409.1 phage tail protein [Paenibacillus glucanolyticus]MDH6672294.1 microcystin-dependent protein [Paenibacillus sp. LBL]MPY16546.1 phage tail protein [Paenibacillus glucanolyticus]